MNRRDVLSMSAIGLTGLVSGCAGSTRTGSPPEPTSRSDPEQRPGSSSSPRSGTSTPEGGPIPTRACDRDSPDSGAGGAPPPWAIADHPADIVVSYDRELVPTVAVRLGQTRRYVSMTAAGDHWLSGDVIPNGREATITVETRDGLTKTLDWKPEEHNRKYASFVVRDDQIQARTGTKTCRSDIE